MVWAPLSPGKVAALRARSQSRAGRVLHAVKRIAPPSAVNAAEPNFGIAETFVVSPVGPLLLWTVRQRLPEKEVLKPAWVRTETVCSPAL